MATNGIALAAGVFSLIGDVGDTVTVQKVLYDDVFIAQRDIQPVGDYNRDDCMVLNHLNFQPLGTLTQKTWAICMHDTTLRTQRD
jgi:hypothetical protein